MPHQIPISGVVDATIVGIKNAQRQYHEWSGGNWLWEAPEFFITTCIANQISTLEGSKYLTLENGASDAIVDAGARGRGRLHSHIREAGRVDILLWWADGTPRAIIEVKNQINYLGQYHDDIKRIDKFLKRSPGTSSLQFGLFAFYDSAVNGPRKSAKLKVADKLANIHGECKSLLGKQFSASLHKSEIHEEEDSAWAAACLLVKPKMT